MVTQTKRIRKATPPRVAIRPRPEPEPTWERVVTRINQGEFDSHLRAIVRACFYRREALTGETHVIAPGEPSSFVNQAEQILDDTAQAVVTGVPRVFPSSQQNSRPALSDLRGMKTWFSTQDVMQRNSLEPIPTRTHYKGEVVRFGSRRYKKSDIIGKKFWYPPELAPQTLHGVTVGVVGVSERVKLLILGVPHTNKGRYQELYVNVEPFFVSKNALMPYLVKQQ